ELHCLRDNGLSNGIAFLPDGRHVASSDADGMLRLWDVKSGDQVRVFKGHKACVYGVAAAPDGKSIASASVDKTVRLWEVESGKELQKFELNSQGGRVAFSPDGRRLLCAEFDGNVLHLLDIRTGRELRPLIGHRARSNHDTIKYVAFTPDSRRALSSGDDGTLRLWDVESGKELYRLTGHISIVRGIAVAPDGRYALAGGYDKLVHVWRLPDPPPAKEKP